MLAALAAKISLYKDFFDPQSEAVAIRLGFAKADKRVKWVNIALTAFYVLTATILIIFSFPVSSFIDMQIYTIVFLAQIGATGVVLVSLLFYIKSNINLINEISGQEFVDENICIRRTVIVFCVSFSLRIVMTSLQMAEVFTSVDLHQFWALQLEFLLCVICEMIPSFNLVY